MHSPNFNDRPEHTLIDTLVIHYTGMKSAEAALNRLCDPKAEVSAHYCIEEEGTIHMLVDPTKRAWHAGISSWRGRENVNHFSIGIELINPGHEFGYRPFPEMQMNALLSLCSELVQRFPIEPRNVIGHSDIAPSRKQDPGELFNWKMLAEHHIGVWAESDKPLTPILSPDNIISVDAVKTLQNKLKRYGYAITADGVYDKETEAVIIAFKRHFCSESLDSSWNERSEHLLDQLLSIA